MEKLKNLKSSIWRYDSVVELEEYMLQENVYDEDDELIQMGDYDELTSFKIRVEDKELNVLGVFDNYSDADICRKEYDEYAYNKELDDWAEIKF